MTACGDVSVKYARSLYRRGDDRCARQLDSVQGSLTGLERVGLAVRAARERTSPLDRRPHR